MKSLLATLPLGLLCAACSVLGPLADDPVRHLLESPLPDRTPTAATPAIAIARPSLPPYLDRSEFITRQPDGRVLLHEQHLWAEPLDASISRVLADNLRRLTGSTNIQPSGNFLSQEYSALVEVRIERFDPTPEGALLLQCTWKVQPVGGGDSSPKAFRTSVPLDDPADPHPARVRAMNEALARLARTIRPAL
jgi:uncharacterized protein